MLPWQVAPTLYTHCTSVWRGSQRAQAAQGPFTTAHSILQPAVPYQFCTWISLLCPVTGQLLSQNMHAGVSSEATSIPEAEKTPRQHTRQTTSVLALPDPPAAAPLPARRPHTILAHRACSGSDATRARAIASASAAAAVCTSAALCAAVTATLPQLAQGISTASDLRRPSPVVYGAKHSSTCSHDAVPVYSHSMKDMYYLAVYFAHP